MSHHFLRSSLLAAATAVSAALAHAAPISWDLDAQPLGSALQRVAQRAGLTLQVAPGLPLAAPARALRGSLDLDEALARLLADSGLTATVSGGTLIVASAVAAAQRIDVIGSRPALDVNDLVRRGQASEVRDLFVANANTDVGGGTRNGQRLYLRGVEGSQLNITIDGARQGANLYNHRGGMSNIDPEIVRRVEVNPGPPGADEGYGALGGSVRFETIDAQDRLQPGRRSGGLVKAGVAQGTEQQRGAVAGFARVGSSLGLLAYASHADADNLRIGGGDRVAVFGRP